jgi:hypothetical protein
MSSADGGPPREEQLAVTRLAPRRVALIATAILLAVGIGATIVAITVVLLTRDTRQDINLVDFGGARADVRALNGYTQATEDLCRAVEGCVQGFGASHAAYRKFASTEDAAAFAASAPDTYRSNWIVIQYTDDELTPADRNEIQEYFDTIATSR